MTVARQPDITFRPEQRHKSLYEYQCTYLEDAGIFLTSDVVFLATVYT